MITSIWLRDGTQSDSAAPSLNGSGINDDDGVLNIPLNSRITASPSDDIVTYTGHSLAVSALPLCRDEVS